MMATLAGTAKPCYPCRLLAIPHSADNPPTAVAAGRYIQRSRSLMNDSHSLGASWSARLISLCLARRLRAGLVLALLVPIVLGMAVVPDPAPAAAAETGFPPY